MKIPEDELHQTELLWDDLIQTQLQFATKNQWKANDETSCFLKISKPHPIIDGIFDIVAKAK